MAAKQVKNILVNNHLKTLLEPLPQKFALAFAYGSAALPQDNQRQRPSMMDYIIAVEDPLSWHKENLKLNPRHYSFLRFGRAGLITKLQENFGAKIYYNSLVKVDDTNMIKYGVISKKHLLHDLLNWSTLYVSGRLHKPVLWLQEPSDPQLKSALNINLSNAVRVALLSLPEIFTDEELFIKMASISYTGDFRMRVGEDPHKVKNIVRPQIESFWQLYESHILSMKVHWNSQTRIIEQDISPSTRIQHLTELPMRVRHQILMLYSKDGHYLDVEDVLITVAHDSDCGEMITEAIGEIVKESSRSQSLKGILTAGLIKSLKYSFSKLKKKYTFLNPKFLNKGIHG